MKRQLTAEEALARMEALCARAEQCTADIDKKLTAMKLPRPVIDKILDRLHENRFIDDSRFAQAYCNDKLMFSGWGRRKIVNGLWLKKIPRSLIDEAISNIDPGEYRRRATEVISSKIRGLGETAFTPQGKTKVLRFAVSRGFEMALSIEIIRKLTAGHVTN
ncbi:MAG: RecX family transcriptional regulator [Lachnoclostridium sp.]|nr:RecX family transcriptional regulator [Lachnoclostridium sp.]